MVRWFLGKFAGALAESYGQRGLVLRTGFLDLKERQRLHQNFQDFLRKNKDAIGNPLDFAVVSDDKLRKDEVRR